MENILTSIGNELEIENSIESELLVLEKKRLDKIIEIALKGIKFKKIYSKHGYDMQYVRSVKEYLKDSNGKDIKAIFLETIYTIKYNDNYNCTVSLILDDNGKFHVIERSNVYDCSDEFIERKILRENIDIFADIPVSNKHLKDEDEGRRWSVDNAINKINDELQERLENLKERNKKQKERLEAIKELDL